MSGLYEKFEKRFTDQWFSAGWIEVEAKPQQATVVKKDLAKLENELLQINEAIENIAQKQLRLENLSKLYNN